MKAIIQFPQMVIETKEVELSEEDISILSNCTNSQEADIIEKYLTEFELRHTIGDLNAAIDYGYAKIIYESNQNFPATFTFRS